MIILIAYAYMLYRLTIAEPSIPIDFILATIQDYTDASTDIQL